MNNLPNIAIIGNGAVAQHLGVAFRDSANIINVAPRTLENLPEKADLYIIAVKDDAIRNVAENMSCCNFNGIVVHTSGATSIDALDILLNQSHIGVMYPLQTFSHGMVIDYSQIPFFIEGDDDATGREIRQICSNVSVNVFEADSEIRARLHLAAVFACNFTNALMAAADSALADTPFDYTVLIPLIKETIRKIEHSHPLKAQTGPAKRNDLNTISVHRDSLKHHKNSSLLEIYDAVTKYIMQTQINQNNI